MRVGIYNRYLPTLGGGEKYCLTIAEHLSQYHQVEVVSHSKVSKEQAAERLNLDLSRVKFVTLSDRPVSEMALITSKYNFYLNASYSDFFPSSAQYSANVVFFPRRLGSGNLVRRKFKGWLQRWMNLPDLLISPHAYKLGSNTQDWVSDAEMKLQLPSRSVDYSVQFDLMACAPQVTSAAVVLDGQIIEEVKFSRVNPTQNCRLQVPVMAGIQSHELLIIPRGQDIHYDGEPRLSLSHLYLDIPSYRMYHRYLEKILVQMKIRLEYNPPEIAVMDYLRTYNAIWTISEYSRSWIERYWHRQSEILYPPVDIKISGEERKLPQILSVGRFFTGQHNKKHLLMIKIFRQMMDEGLTGWKLILAGGTTEGEDHQAYLSEVFEQAQGYPIEIQPDIPYSDLSNLYASSSIYWHASGYGENEKRHPEKFEHFGITTAEAMAAGCVPVVIAKGGQPEIVQHGRNGFLWSNLEDLKNFTRILMEDKSLRQSLALQAEIDSQKYSKEAFSQRLDELMMGYR